MTARYIGTGGQITRRSGARLQDFSYRRLSIIFGTLLFLFVTNPANDVSLSSLLPLRLPLSIASLSSKSKKSPKHNKSSSDGGGTSSSRKLGTLRSEWLGIEINISSLSEKTPRRRASYTNGNSNSHASSAYISRYFKKGTNYHLFALSKGARGVDIGIAWNKFPICTFDGRGRNLSSSSSSSAISPSLSSSLCYWVADNLCHEHEMFDPTNKAFTILRFMQILKILSLILQSCYIYRATTPLFPKISFGNILHRPSSLFFSIFHEPYSLKDFLSLNIYLYPSLSILEKVTSFNTPNERTAAVHFYGIAFVLIFIIGSIANLLASYLLSSKVGGMKGSIASCLGFLSAVKTYAIVIEWFDVQLTAGDALFSTFAVTLISSILGFTSVTAGEWEIGNVVSWAFGGVLGYAVGEYQKDRLQPWLLYFFS